MTNFVRTVLSILTIFIFACANNSRPPATPLDTEGQPPVLVGELATSRVHVHESVPILEGDPAPFDGVLVDENRAIQAVQDAAEVNRLRVEVSAQQNILDLTERTYTERLSEQNDELNKTRNWLRFAFPAGLVVGLGLGLLSAWGIYNSSQ